MYRDAYLNQWMQPDTIVPDWQNPQTLNRYMYVNGNPVNFTDPSGLCPTCYIFFFPGLGNQGDINDPEFGGKENRDVFDNLGPGEQDMVRQLRDQTKAKVFPIYPYGSGLAPSDGHKRENLPVLIAAGYGMSSVPQAKAMEILENIQGACTENNNVTINTKKLNVTFIGYSGGGQIAYSTAQKLKGKVFVDNLVLFGAPLRAYNGVSNIGRIWELVGEHDDLKNPLGQSFGQYLDHWNDYNKGVREYQLPGLPTVIRTTDPKLSIYNNGATRCTLYGDDKHPYVHSHPENDYFGSASFLGAQCVGSYTSTVARKDWKISRLGFNLFFLRDIVGVGKPK